MATEIELDFSEYEKILSQSSGAESDLLKLQLEHAIDEVLEYVKSTWSQVTYGSRIPGMTNSFFDPEYAPSLKTERHGFKGRVYTDYRGAAEIQYGRPSIDLKPGLLNGPGAKINQRGQRYNVVPFKHRTPAGGSSVIKALPEDVYRAALHGQRISANSEMGMRDRRAGWAVGPYAGLRRELASSSGRGEYRTYRTVSERHLGTPKWVIPALPPIDVVSLVQRYVEPRVQEIVNRYLS